MGSPRSLPGHCEHREPQASAATTARRAQARYLQASSASVRSRSGRESSQSRMVSLNFPLENTHKVHGFPCQAGTGSRAVLREGTLTQILAQHCEGQREPRQPKGTHRQARGGTEFTRVRDFVAGAAMPPKPWLFCRPSSELGHAFHSPVSELSQQSSAPWPRAPGSAVPPG